MIISNISELAYELYKIDWMRRISPERQMDSIKDYYDDKRMDPDDDSDYDDVLFEFGFDGEFYVCFEEFLDNEYRDKDYMKSLLNEDQYKEYLEDIKEKKGK